MSTSLPETALFKPTRSKSETKADITTSVARAILDEEVAKREAKTAKLRAARLEQEESQAALEEAASSPAKAARKTTGRARAVKATTRTTKAAQAK